MEGTWYPGALWNTTRPGRVGCAQSDRDDERTDAGKLAGPQQVALFPLHQRGEGAAPSSAQHHSADTPAQDAVRNPKP